MHLLRKEVKNNYDKQFTIVTTHKNVQNITMKNVDRV